MNLFKYIKNLIKKKGKDASERSASDNSESIKNHDFKQIKEKFKAKESEKVNKINYKKGQIRKINRTLDYFPPRSIYVEDYKTFKHHVIVKKLPIQKIETGIPGVRITLEPTLKVSGVIAPTQEEVESCYFQLANLIEKDTFKKNNGNELTFYKIPFEELIFIEPEFETYINSNRVSSMDLVKAIRSRIRELLKRKENHEKYVEYLIKAVYLNDLTEELAVKCEYKGTFFKVIREDQLMTRRVASEIRKIELNYEYFGYELFPSFGKTDIKWITNIKGEPISHGNPKNIIKEVKEYAVIEYYDSINRDKYSSASGVTEGKLPILQLLKSDIELYLGYHKSWFKRMEDKNKLDAVSIDYLVDSIKVMNAEFIIADLETTGIDAYEDKIIEIGAILCDAKLQEKSRFSRVVKVKENLKPKIIELTGITDEIIQHEGEDLEVVLNEFSEFTGARPIFFHNSRFDCAFLRQALLKHQGIRMENDIFDTLTMAKEIWPDLQSYSLGELSQKIYIKAPSHRAIADVLATNKVLKALRDEYLSKNNLEEKT